MYKIYHQDRKKQQRKDNTIKPKPKTVKELETHLTCKRSEEMRPLKKKRICHYVKENGEIACNSNMGGVSGWFFSL